MFNWLDIADWCKQHVCYERQRCGSCGCKGRNACARGTALAMTCERMDKGEAGDPRAVFDFVRGKCCQDSRKGVACSHRGCERAERLQRWIVTASKKAAA